MASVTSKKSQSTFQTAQRPSTGSICDIADGELIVLVGPSGSGKSTVLRMIAGLEDIATASSGSASATSRSPAQERDIAMVFQSYALYPHLTVRDNMAFGLSHRENVPTR